MAEIILETKRLLLKPYSENDFKAVHEYASDIENTRFMIWGPNSENDTSNFLRDTIEKNNRMNRTDYDFAIYLKSLNELIGGCGIYVNETYNEGMLGWIINKKYWKNGYGTEFAKELIRFGFETLNLHRIYATCDSENYGSYRVMERNHMRKEAHFIKNRKTKDEWRDELHYAILREEWD